MNDPSYDHALALFAKAVATGVWDADGFAQWCTQANTHAWNQLEEAWQREGNPEGLSWPVLKNAVEEFAQRFHAPPLMTFSTFLFPPGVRTSEGHWLDWQTDATKEDIFRTAQHWMEHSNVVLQDQAETLLVLASWTKTMPLWRAAPETCVQDLDWQKAMSTLNGCGRKVLTLADIERIPTGDPNVTRLDLLRRAMQFQWHNIARCIELEAGPGMWVQHVFEGDPRSETYRRKQAWENMLLDGVDSWALIQYYLPGATFEESMEDLRRDKAVLQHEAWARQWWVHCVLGMNPAQAHSMASCVRAPVAVDDTYEVDAALFTDSEPVVS